jgi:hypothetical protein
MNAAYSEAGDASDGAAGAGAGAGSGAGSGAGDWGLGEGGAGYVCLADCSWDSRMVSRQVSVS